MNSSAGSFGLSPRLYTVISKILWWQGSPNYHPLFSYLQDCIQFLMADELMQLMLRVGLTQRMQWWLLTACSLVINGESFCSRTLHRFVFDSPRSLSWTLLSVYFHESLVCSSWSLCARSYIVHSWTRVYVNKDRNQFGHYHHRLTIPRFKSHQRLNCLFPTHDATYMTMLIFCFFYRIPLYGKEYLDRNI
jgi:hypothetical protein